MQRAREADKAVTVLAVRSLSLGGGMIAGLTMLPRVRRSYMKIILTVIEADGEWLPIDLEEVAPGSSIRAKQSRLLTAAKNRGLPMQTKVQDGALYMRLHYVPE
jgi:hypothetical protein